MLFELTYMFISWKEISYTAESAQAKMFTKCVARWLMYVNVGFRTLTTHLQTHTHQDDFEILQKPLPLFGQ